MDTICACMARDNARSQLLFKEACEQIRHGDWPGGAATVAALGLALERHLTIEEELVFAAFDAGLDGAASPTAALRVEHKWIRGVLFRLTESTAGRDASLFFKHAQTLDLLLQYHLQREAIVFYPAAEQMLAAEGERLQGALKARIAAR
jgi:hypothetical protein